MKCPEHPKENVIYIESDNWTMYCTECILNPEIVKKKIRLIKNSRRIFLREINQKMN